MRRLLIVTCVCVAAAVGIAAGDPTTVGAAGEAVAGPAALSHPDATPVEDPFPLRRLRATEAQLAEIQKQLEPGPVVRLPRGEFEARVRAAGRAAAAAKQLPRVADARFKAALAGGDLVGTAELDLVAPNGGAHFLPLDPLRLAVGSAAWADGRPALLGTPLGGTGAGVWVERPGPQTLKFAWSAAGVTEPGERRFELRVPPAPAASLELELPAGEVPAVPSTDVLLTGPFPAPGQPPRAAWRVRFGNRSRLDLAVRPAGNPGVTASAILNARYDLAPGQLAAAFEYELRPSKGTVGEWSFAIDPGLRVTDVVVNNRAGWTIDPPGEPDKPRRLKVALRQPGAGGKVLVSAVAPFPDPSRPANSPLPAVRPVGATLAEETLDVRLSPYLRVVNWDSGDYRLTDTQTLADQTRSLGLTGTLLPPGADRPFRRLPRVAVAATEPDFTTTERVAWHLDPERPTAVVRVSLKVRRGPLFSLALKPPPGYTLARASSAPEEVLASFGTSRGNAVVEFARPLSAGQSSDLTFEFRGQRFGSSSHELPFPGFAPVGAAERVGVLGVFPAPGWDAEFLCGAGTGRAGWFDPFGPQPPAGASAAFRYRGNDPDGRAELTPSRPEFAVAAGTKVEQRRVEIVGTTSFALGVGAGALSSLAVAEPDAGFAGRTWQTAESGNAVVSAVPVPVESLVRRCVPSAAVWPGRLWLLRFARPVTGDLTLQTSATLPGGADPEPFAQLAVLGASRYRLVAAEPKPANHASPARSWAFSNVYLVTAVRSGADAVLVFGGTVSSAGGATLPILMPPGVAEVRAAAVGGRWVEPSRLRLSADGVLELPIPATPAARFELRYRVTPESAGLVVPARSPEPRLPGGEVRVSRWWAFAPEFLPGWPVRSWERDAPENLPAMLGGLPISGRGVTVWRSGLDEVRVARTRTADAVGVAVAALLAVLAAAGARRRHPLAGILAVGVLLGVGVGGQLGPPWWQRAAVVPVVAGLIVVGAMAVARGLRARLPTAAAALLLAFTQSDTGAQPAAPATVVILPPGADGRETVVAPKAVLDRLAAAARPASPGVILTAAEYTATADDTAARVVAQFTAHALGAEQVATLPLADARLERVTVDGKPAFASAPRPGLCAVPLPGPGRHEIEVRFAVTVAGTGPERDFRFGVPEVPSARIAADLPGGAKQAHVVGRLGAQTVANDRRVRVSADLGAVKTVQVRWRDAAGGAAAVRVREGCVWDVSEDGAELTACYLVRVEQGTISSLRIDTPAELDPLAVAVRAVADPLRPLEPVGVAALRDWSAGPEAGGFRPLRLDFQGPTAGRVLVVLSLAPRKVATRHPVLRFPKVVFPGAPAEPDAAYGVRAKKDVVIEELVRPGAIDFSPDALTRDFAAVTELRLDPGSQIRVFRPTAPGAAELRPTLRPAAEPPAFTLDTTWQLAPRRADAAGTVHWVGKEKDPPAMLEFALPGVRVNEVRGADVAAWNQAGGRVQVWLRKSVKEGDLAWNGTREKPPAPFEAFTPRPAEGRLAADTVRVQPADGFALTVERDRGWTHTAWADDPVTYRTNNPAFPPVRVELSAVPPVARPEEFGWFGPSRRPAPRLPSSPAESVSPRTTRGDSREPDGPRAEPDVRWVWPVSTASVWAGGLLLLAVLLARFPRSTWPEQIGLAAALFGLVVAGGWAVGLVAWAAARVAAAAVGVARPVVRA
jgi:hypothetical protein